MFSNGKNITNVVIFLFEWFGSKNIYNPNVKSLKMERAHSDNRLFP
jgi:hypothetical protein